VRGYGQWADYSLVDPATTYCAKLDDGMPISSNMSVSTAQTAGRPMSALWKPGAAKAGETFVVSAAAGCTGIMAAQIAKALWLPGDRHRGRRDEMRPADEPLRVRRSGRLQGRRCGRPVAGMSLPEGIDLYFDNVGGEILDAALGHDGAVGRVAICGLLTNYTAQGPVPGHIGSIRC